MSQLSDRDIAAIVKVHDRWIEAELTGNNAQLIDFCTDDVRWIPSGSPPLAGKGAIARYLDFNRVDVKEVRTTEVVICGNDSVAYLTSNFSTRYTSQHSTEIVESTGTHVWILRKEAEQWRVAVVTWSLWQ